MRNMSFSMTTEQVRAGTKDVTRRRGWWLVKPGEVVMACEKCQGLKKGEKVKRIRPIKIKDARTERLWDITPEDVRREGFPGMSPREFVKMFCAANKCEEQEPVRRIEFEYLPGGWVLGADGQEWGYEENGPGKEGE